jgi:hypothetical protein
VKLLLTTGRVVFDQQTGFQREEHGSMGASGRVDQVQVLADQVKREDGKVRFCTVMLI